jgi:hypothetical protein
VSMATDEECRVAIDTLASLHDKIIGFSTQNERSRKWGAPHYIRDVRLPPGQQEIWRGGSQDEMLDRCEIERMKVALDAVFELHAAR